jgi:hypothetical protein
MVKTKKLLNNKNENEPNIKTKSLSQFNSLIKHADYLFKDYSQEQYKVFEELQSIYIVSIKYRRNFCDKYYKYNAHENTMNKEFMERFAFVKQHVLPYNKEYIKLIDSIKHYAIEEYVESYNSQKKLIMYNSSDILHNLNISNKFQYDVVILPNYNIKDIIYEIRMTEFEHVTVFNKLMGSFLFSEFKLFLKELQEMKHIETQYDFIYVQFAQYEKFKHLGFIFTIMIPVLLSSITCALKLLKKGGNLVINMFINYPFPIMNKLIQLLDNCFTNICCNK